MHESSGATKTSVVAKHFPLYRTYWANKLKTDKIVFASGCYCFVLFQQKHPGYKEMWSRTPKAMMKDVRTKLYIQIFEACIKC